MSSRPSKWMEREYKKRQEYYIRIKEQKTRAFEREQERLRALGMLLDAEWAGTHFIQRKEAGGFSVYCYFDKDGNVINSVPTVNQSRWENNYG